MAALKPEVKAAIVQMLACYDSLSIVVDAIQKNFGIKVTPQQVESHDPTKVSGKGLAKKWVDLFNATRKRFQNEISDIPIANKAYRLRAQSHGDDYGRNEKLRHDCPTTRTGRKRSR